MKLKRFDELNEAMTSSKMTQNDLRKNYKFVADVTDPSTNAMLKAVWASWNEKQRKKALDTMGHSDKYCDAAFDDLTGEIQAKIITVKTSLDRTNFPK